MSGAIIRQARPEDADLLLRFIRELAEYEREPDAVKVTAATLAAQMRQAQPPFECLIADLADQPVGFALFFATYSTWLGRPGIYLEDLYVTPVARGQGIGRALLQELAIITRKRGGGRLEWSVLDWNQPAIDFYRRLGAAPKAEWIRFCIVDDAQRRLAEGEAS